MKYMPLNIVMSNREVQAPQFLDSINFEKNGVNFKVYGVLHALSGGTNQEYVNLVNKTIAHEKSKNVTVLSEKAMKKMYRGIDQEVEDWIQVPPKDLFRIGLNMILPHNFLIILWTIIKEKLTKKSRFNIKSPSLEDIGGSPFFHVIKPSQRRLLAGFPSPKDYLENNLSRIIENKKIKAPVFPDKDWRWLNILEPYVNIPLRSIHMFEYSLSYAKSNNLSEVALFVGEIHNSDIDWYVQDFDLSSLSNEQQQVIVKSKENVQIALSGNFKKERFKYFFFSMFPVAIMFWVYLLIFMYVFG